MKKLVLRVVDFFWNLLCLPKVSENDEPPEPKQPEGGGSITK